MYTRPSNGIMTSFPTLDGNQISSDEEEQEQEQEDSDPYIGVAFGSTYWNKGGQFSNLTYAHSIISRMFQCVPTCKGWLNNNSKWQTKMAHITVRIQVIPDPRWESSHDSRPLMGIVRVPFMSNV